MPEFAKVSSFPIDIKGSPAFSFKRILKLELLPISINLLLESKVILFFVSVVELNVQPPIAPDIAFKTPALVTLNGAEANVP